MKTVLIMLISTICLWAGTKGKLSGTIKDAQTGEILIGANILLEGTNLGAASNTNGEFVILNIPPGKYNVQASYLGYETFIIQEVTIIVDQTTQLDVELSSKSIQVGEVVVVAKSKLIQKDVTSSISVITRDEIESLPVTSFEELLTLQAGVVGRGNNLYVRGGRANEVSYIVDGM